MVTSALHGSQQVTGQQSGSRLLYRLPAGLPGNPMVAQEGKGEGAYETANDMSGF